MSAAAVVAALKVARIAAEQADAAHRAGHKALEDAWADVCLVVIRALDESERAPSRCPHGVVPRACADCNELDALASFAGRGMAAQRAADAVLARPRPSRLDVAAPQTSPRQGGRPTVRRSKVRK